MLRLDLVSTKELTEIYNRMNRRIDEASEQVKQGTRDLKVFTEIRDAVKQELEKRKDESETKS